MGTRALATFFNDKNEPIFNLQVKLGGHFGDKDCFPFDITEVISKNKIEKGSLCLFFALMKHLKTETGDYYILPKDSDGNTNYDTFFKIYMDKIVIYVKGNAICEEQHIEDDKSDECMYCSETHYHPSHEIFNGGYDFFVKIMMNWNFAYSLKYNFRDYLALIAGERNVV